MTIRQIATIYTKRQVESVMRLMQIGELSQRSSVSHRTIHYYERLGLLHPAERKDVGYRYYDETALLRLSKIAALKRLGLSLDEIVSVIDLYFEDATGIRGKRKVLDILRNQLDRADAQLAELTSFRRDIETSITRIEELIDAAGEGGAR